MTTTLCASGRLMAVSACLIVFSMPLVSAQDRSQYRDYQIGNDLRTIAEQSGVPPPVAQIIPRDPVGLQELEWRPHYSRGAARQTDAVARVTFGFYNDQLFRIVIDYDRLRTEGMTEADMVGAISETYGPPSRRVVPTGPVVQRDEPEDLLVATWEDADNSVTLLRVLDSSAFRMIVASTRLRALAQDAGAGAVQLDSHEAPQHDVPARIHDVDEDGQSGQQRARRANKAAFKP
jgi:hypothetical protein